MSDVAYKTPDDYAVHQPRVVLPDARRAHRVAVEDGPDFVAEAKANPGKLRVGSPGEGTSSHLNLEELMSKAGIQVTHVPFAGWGQSAPRCSAGTSRRSSPSRAK